ncbi:MAG: hypothetical protein ACT6RL_11305 [Neoaquamicrobium sediminum]|uniref:hypothetical protein n=1 Tax=Neoaquamicrobium sediminum TaxID=1849104 RepID=UPI0040367D3F
MPAASKRAALWARVETLEHRLISRFDRALAALSDKDRADYERYWQRRNEWLKQKSPETVYASFNDADLGPKLPPHIHRQLFDKLVHIYEDEDEYAAREKYYNVRDGNRI